MDTSGEPTQYLTFVIGEEEYALGILRVREIIQYDVVTRVPRLPPWIRGVINLRGGVVPVIDLARKLGLPPREVTKETCVVITDVEAEGESHRVGVVADSVCQVVDLGPRDIEPVPAFGTKVRVDYLVGMGRAERRFVLILDADKIVTGGELTEASALDGVDDEPAGDEEPRADAGLAGLA
jgi:purine-binding chemotaxis protein CheW